MTRFAASLLLVVLLAAPAAAETLPPSITAVKNQVRETFDQFRRAVLRGDRGSVTKMLTGQSVKYGAALLKMAQTWEKARLQKQGAVTQIAVLGLRLDTEPAELDAMSPAEAFARTYEAGVVDPLVFEEMTLVQIELGSGRETASALIGIGEQRGDEPVFFEKSGDRWLVDPFAISNQISFSLTVLLKSRGVEEDEYVAGFMQQMYGEAFEDSVWQPTATRSGAGPGQ